HDETNTSTDALNSISIKGANSLDVAGDSTSGTLSTLDATTSVALTATTNHGGKDALVIRIDPTKLGPGAGTGDGVEALTLKEFGGSGDDVAAAVSVDTNGMVFVGGTTASLTAGPGQFPSSNGIPSLDAAILGAGKSQAGFVAEFNQDFSTTFFATLIGG